ncbi:MAG: DUF1656 domain-containing protein [Sulfurimonas sp.]|nr:DUF1656 domain-containing protein [Sulfurimonas sp.]
MEKIITIGGVQMPALIAIFIAATFVQIVLNYILSSIGFYKYVWHEGLFRTALFVCIFTIPAIYIYQ